MFSPQLLDHFQHPRNAGELPKPDAVVELTNPVCGDVLKFTLQVKDGQIARIRFLAKGCVPAMACASAITELAQGKRLEQARNLCPQDVVSAVGGLPPASVHAAQLALDALHQALRQIQATSTSRPASR